MSGYSTIVDGTIVSPIRFNYDLNASTSGTIASKYLAAGIVDKVGLQVVIRNTSGSAITLIAGTSFTNATSYPQIVAGAFFQLAANQTVTLITKTIGQDYTISALSNQYNVKGGSTGQLVYQSAANTTDFAPVGTAGYVLTNLVGTPAWEPFVVPNLALSPAGSVDYQSATSVTTTTGAGTAFNSAGGSLMSNTSGTSNWSNLTINEGFTDSSFASNTLTLKAARCYTIYTSTLPAGGVLINTWIRLNIGYVAGNSFVIVNDRTTTFQLTLQDFQNGSSYSASFFNTGTATINLAPDESVELQQYNPTGLTINTTTQSQGWMAWGTNAASPWVVNTDAPINFQTRTDPNSWFKSKNGGTNNAVQPNKAGYYAVTFTLSWAGNTDGLNYSNANNNIQIQKNNVQVNLNQNCPTITVNQEYMTFVVSSVVYLNGTTDYVNVTARCGYNSSFFPVIYANGTNLAVVLLT